MRTKKSLSVIINLAVISLCLIASSFAWISMSTSVKSGNHKMTIQAVSDVTTISCYALRYDGSLGAVCYKIGEGEGEVLDVEMTEFDRIFRDRSVNTPLIYVVELANVPDNEGNYISIKVPCREKYISVSGSKTNEYTASSDAVFSIQNYISNIISVKIGCGGAISALTPTTTQRIQNNVDRFNTERTAFKSVTSGDRVGQFAVASGATYTKTNSVQVKLTQAEYTSYLFTLENEDESTGNHLILYIQFDYDEALMDAYINLISDDLDEDIAFADDLEVIQILVGTGGN